MTPICKVSEVPPGSSKRVELADAAPVAVFNLDGSFYVIDDTCTHGKASLADGYLEGEEVECPFHGGRFCVKTGEARSFPATEAVKSYPVQVVGDDVCIAREA